MADQTKVKLTDRNSIEEVIKEMTMEEKNKYVISGIGMQVKRNPQARDPGNQVIRWSNRGEFHTNNHGLYV